jgi:hypothetical protein
MLPAQIQPFLHFSRPNPPRINTSKKISHVRISLIIKGFKFTGINTSGAKDLKSRRISTSKKHRRGEGQEPTACKLYLKFASAWLTCAAKQSPAFCASQLYPEAVGSPKGNTLTGVGICRTAAGGSWRGARAARLRQALSAATARSPHAAGLG